MPSPLDCSQISAECPIEASIYGYYPSMPANAFFLAFFAIFGIANLALGWRYKTWTYLVAMGLACSAQTIGYIGRVLLHSNPFSQIGFEMQICALTIAPAFNSAAIYLTLKHLVKCFGRESSRLRPKYYTWIFISADILSLIFQGAGGGIAATSNNNDSLRNVGDALMMTGICLQVVTLLIFGTLSADYAIRRHRSPQPLSVEAMSVKTGLKFQLFFSSLIVAYLTIFTRCIYRIAEMAGGWSNPIMQDQALFIALDSVMVTIATLLQTTFHPGYCFPRLAAPFKKASKQEEKTLSENSEEEV